MYYLLTLIGVVLIVLGINDKEIKKGPDQNSVSGEFIDLLQRIEGLEKIIYDVDLNFEEEKVESFEVNYQSVGETIDITDEPLTIFDTLRLCEEEGYSLEKTCSTLNMNKGEVLLLKNLYKNYQA